MDGHDVVHVALPASAALERRSDPARAGEMRRYA